jgi:hypothetical protein
MTIVIHERSLFSHANERLSYGSLRCVAKWNGSRRSASNIPYQPSTLREPRKPAAERVPAMPSSLRFIIGAILAGATLYVSALGLLATARLRHMAKPGPIEVSRNLLFDDRMAWNQFYNADGARRFEKLARKPSASEPAETSALAAPRAPEQAAPEASEQPAAEKPSEERPAEQSERKPPPVASAVESKPPDPDDSSAAGRPPASTSGQVLNGQVLNGQVLNGQVLNGQVVVAPREPISPAIAGTAAAIPGSVTLTTAPATPIDPSPVEPPVAQTVTNAPPVTRPDETHDVISAVGIPESGPPKPTQPSPPRRDEEPLVIAPRDVLQSEERETSAPATAGSVIAPHAESAAVPPVAPHAIAAGTARASAARPRKIAPRARPARDADADEPAPKARVAKRRHVHASRPVAHYRYQYAQPYWQPY